MTPDEAQAWAYRLMHQVAQHQRAVFKASAPIPLPEPKAPERHKPGTRRVPHTPKGMGPRRVWSVK